MVFCSIFIFLFYYISLSCNALRCTTNCSFTSKLTTPFNIPDRCNQLVEDYTCLASVVISYDRGEYDVYLKVASGDRPFIIENRRYVWLKFPSPISSTFSYTIERKCSNKDDCARDLIKTAATEMLQRQINYSVIMDQGRPLVVGPPLPSNDSYLKCYDSNQTVKHCGTLIEPIPCLIYERISEKNISIGCPDMFDDTNVSIGIYQSDNSHDSFYVYCNRSLCNTLSTLQTAKELMFKYHITVTLDGRLSSSSSKLIISILAMIMMIFIVL